MVIITVDESALSVAWFLCDCTWKMVLCQVGVCDGDYHHPILPLNRFDVWCVINDRMCRSGCVVVRDEVADQFDPHPINPRQTPKD